MTRIVRMPAVMANATDAILSEWLAAPGAKIAIGDPLAEIETDKAVVEYAAETEGTIGQFLVEPGARVAVGDPIVVLLEDGEDASAIGAASVDSVVHASPEAAPQPTVVGSGRHRLIASPIARRIAAERGIDLAALTGTGPNGRIVRRDVVVYNAVATPGTRRPLAAPATGGYSDVPLTPMRRAIAQRLTESKSTVPHFYVTAHVRVDRLLELRAEANRSSARKLSINDFVVKAVAAAMVEVPAANAIWNGESIRHFEGVDLAVAVSVPGGLLTPVVRGAEHLGLVELSTQIAELVSTARSGRLQQHQLEGGSFTVSSLGTHGAQEFSAIINPPQSGILAVGAATRQPVVDADGQLSVGTVMTVTLSADHRVIDGALAAEWIAALVTRLENPVSLLL